jgi:hypothetical protein
MAQRRWRCGTVIYKTVKVYVLRKSDIKEPASKDRGAERPKNEVGRSRTVQNSIN